MSANYSIVKFNDGREICLSYGVPVAAFIPKSYVLDHSAYEDRGKTDTIAGYIKTDRKYSSTTSKHANAFAGSDATVVPHETFKQLVTPLECK